MLGLHNSEIFFEKKLTYVDGQPYNRAQLSDLLSVCKNTIYKKFLKIETKEDRVLWLRKKLWLKHQGLPSNRVVYYRDNFFTTIEQIIAATGLKEYGAAARGRKFEEGVWTKKDLFDKPRSKPGFTSSHRSNWGSLKGGAPRNCNLDHIPDPTKYERKIGGVFTNHRPIGLANRRS